MIPVRCWQSACRGLLLLNLVWLGGFVWAGGFVTPAVSAQETSEPDEALAERLAEQALAEPSVEPAAETEAAPTPKPPPSMNILDLTLRGGWLMIPIGMMSLIVVAFGIERALALRRRRIMPKRLIDSLGKVAAAPTGFDPRKAYRLCQQYPSSAATIIRAMLLKVGRPLSEVEQAVNEASEREAARLYGNVRTLNMAAAISPLLGLLGTVWGMIEAFFVTANLPAGVNRAEMLADGIYVALVTTAAGLIVAIPAAMLAHLFEGRIQRVLLDVGELASTLMPHIERYEGKLRVSRAQLSDDEKPPAPEPPRQTAAAG